MAPPVVKVSEIVSPLTSSVGGFVSTTVTGKPALAWLPDGSIAVQLTSQDPIG